MRIVRRMYATSTHCCLRMLDEYDIYYLESFVRASLSLDVLEYLAVSSASCHLAFGIGTPLPVTSTMTSFTT